MIKILSDLYWTIEMGKSIEPINETKNDLKSGFLFLKCFTENCSKYMKKN